MTTEEQDREWMAAAGLDGRRPDCEALAKMPLASVLYQVLVSGRRSGYLDDSRSVEAMAG
jgi:hypothetical protein